MLNTRSLILLLLFIVISSIFFTSLIFKTDYTYMLVDSRLYPRPHIKMPITRLQTGDLFSFIPLYDYTLYFLEGKLHFVCIILCYRSGALRTNQRTVRDMRPTPHSLTRSGEDS